MLQVKSVLHQKLSENQNSKRKKSKYIQILLEFALFHFIMLLLGKDTEVLSFVTQLSNLNLQDHLWDTTTAHVVSVSHSLCSTLLYHTKVKAPVTVQGRRLENTSRSKRTKVGETGMEAFGVHLVSLGAPAQDTRHGRRTPTIRSYLHPYLGQFFRSYGGKLSPSSRLSSRKGWLAVMGGW